MVLAEKFLEVSKARALLGAPLASSRDLHNRVFLALSAQARPEGKPIATTDATRTSEPLQQLALIRICYPDAIRIHPFLPSDPSFSHRFFLLAVSCIFIDRWYRCLFASLFYAIYFFIKS